MKKKKYIVPKACLATNTVESAAPASVWGYKGCSGKGGKTTNAVIMNHENEKEKETK